MVEMRVGYVSGLSLGVLNQYEKNCYQIAKAVDGWMDWNRPHGFKKMIIFVTFSCWICYR